MEVGFQEKIAATVASVIQPVKIEGNTIIADCKDNFYRYTVINSRMSTITEVAKECWGPDIEIFIRSEADTQFLPKKRTRGEKKGTKPKSQPEDSLFASPEAPVESLPLAPLIQAKIKSSKEKLALPERPLNVEQGEVFEPEKKTEAKEEKAPATAVLHASRNLDQISKSTKVTPIALGEDFEGRQNALLEAPLRGLMPEFTFSTFVRGQSNLIAYSACESIARNPGNLTNPVFIYGATGLGKTHLLHSVGNEIKRNHPDWMIVYVTSGDFMNELIASIRFNRQEVFRNKYRLCDVLLVDDIQFLENKDATQLEFFHTFNELYQKKKQIVITSDKYPRDIPNIEERLKSRFLQGLIADIEPPSFEDRVAIIDAKSKGLGLRLSREIILHISTHVKSNVREIQGVLNNLLMTQSMSGKIPTIESTNSLLRRIVRVSEAAADIPTIQRAVASYFGIKLSDLLSANRSQKFVVPRHIAMFLAKELTSSPVTEIAESFGKKDHTTVMHAISKVRELLEKDASTRTAIQDLKRKLDQNPL